MGVASYPDQLFIAHCLDYPTVVARDLNWELNSTLP